MRRTVEHPRDSVSPALPDVTERDGRLYVDLRPWNGPACQAIREGVPRAVAAQAALSAWLVRAAAPEGDKHTVAQACDLYLRVHSWPSAGGRRWAESYLALVRKEVGGYLCREVTTPLLRAYVRKLRDGGMTPKTAAQRQMLLLSALRAAEQEGWITGTPAKVQVTRDCERMSAPPDYTTIREDEFRELRGQLYAAPQAMSALRSAVGPELADVRVAERRAFLSWAYYTGAHKADTERAVSDWVDLSTGMYLRHNQKSSRVVPPAPLRMPEQLLLDLRELARVTGPWSRGHVLFGGPWASACVPLQRAADAARLGVRVNMRSVLRRSCAWQYMIRGWRREDVAEVLGHVDRTMVERVYSRLDVAHRYATQVPWDLAHPEPRRPSAVERLRPRRHLRAV